MQFGQTWRRQLARVLAPCLLALGLVACGSDGGSSDTPNPPPPTQAVGTVSGRVLSSATGAGVAGVKVSAGTRSTTSGADGSYSLAQVPAGDPTPLSYELAGYAPAFASVVLADGGTATANPRLLVVGATQTFAAATAATVTVAGSPARVDLPAASLVNARTGAAASGTITAELTVIDPATDPAGMPGNYTAAAAGGGRQTIESFGAISVNLRDAAGNALNLATGQRATIRIPVSTRSADVPATMPLFYFNETTGLWVQEGTATLAGTAPNLYYEGTVAHFSIWNADQVSETIRVNGCVVDANGNPVANVDVSTVGQDYSGQARGLTNAQGRFSVPMRKGGIASVFGELGTRATNVRSAGPSQVDIELTPCLVLGSSAQAPTIIVQPASQTAQAGGFVLFEVRAIGSGVLRYQWTRNGTPIASVTGAALLVFPVAAGDDGALYRVIVTNDVGSVTSDPATLSVPAEPQPPLIVTQPQPASATVGGTASFSVGAQSQGGTLSYQWRRNGAPVAGATASSTTTPVLSAGDDGALYSVLVSSSNGTSVLSNAVRLTVTGVPVAPSITTQPRDVSVGVGQAASFSVVADGTPTLRYQWRREGADIAGATAATYTTPATVLGDSGARFSVVVSNDTGSATSTAATLTVTPPVGQGGYYLLAPAGATVQGTVTFANGTQTLESPALVAVSTSNPSATPVTLVPAGQGSGFGLPVFEGTVAGGQLSNLRSRYSVYLQGNRFYKVDQLVSGSGAPAPQLLTDLSTQAICGANGTPLQDFDVEGFDLADPVKSWLFVRAPGADGQCGNADDVVRAARVEMGPTSSALNLGTAIPVAGVRSNSGAFTGLVVRNGTQLQLLNAELGGATNLFTVGANFANGPVVMAGSAPGVWFFADAGKVWAVDLAAPATRREVATLAAGEVLGTDVLGSGAEFFVPLDGTSGTRVVRVAAAGLAATPLATFSSRVTNLLATDTHLVATTASGNPQAVPRSGGTPVPLLSLALGESVTQASVGASTVALSVLSVNFQTGDFGTRVVLVNADGSNPQTLPNAALVGSVAAASMPLTQTLDRAYAVFVADNVASGINQAGATVRALALDTRSTLVTYGTLPATPEGQLISFVAGPLQYTQPGLFAFVGISGQTAAYDLIFFDSDSPGLTRVTQFIGNPGRAAAARVQRAANARR